MKYKWPSLILTFFLCICVTTNSCIFTHRLKLDNALRHFYPSLDNFILREVAEGKVTSFHVRLSIIFTSERGLQYDYLIHGRHIVTLNITNFLSEYLLHNCLFAFLSSNKSFGAGKST